MSRTLIILFAFLQLCQAAEKPNVLFILIDDFGWNDVGYNGSQFYETPQIDKFAKEWMRFDNCYTPNPMCSPTRTSILTGKNPARHGITQWLSGVDRFFGRKGEEPVVYCPALLVQGIQDSETTLGEAFSEAGYDTAFMGKWHMGKLNATGGPAKHGYTTTKAIIEENACRLFDCARYFPGKGKRGDYYTDLLLFNLAADPNETKNLAATMPEIAKALDSQLMNGLKEVGAYLPVAPTPEQKESQLARRDRKKKGK